MSSFFIPSMASQENTALCLRMRKVGPLIVNSLAGSEDDGSIKGFHVRHMAIIESIDKVQN